MTATELVRPVPAESSPRVKQADAPIQHSRETFLVGPWFDLLFILNIYWPVLAYLSLLGGEQWQGSILFWQVYFITAPHRWITLLLVAADPSKRQGREHRFLLITLGIVGACLILQLNSSSLLCLGAIDYLWNAWHFAAQHHGIQRIYAQHSKATNTGTSGLLEKILFRAFLLYTIGRVAGLGWTGRDPLGLGDLRGVDIGVALIPCGIMYWQWYTATRWHLGMCYTASVMLLFLSLLGAAHYEKSQLVIHLALASAVFHSIEYFAIVTWATRKPDNYQREDMLGGMVRNWALFIAFFMLFMGATNYFIAVGYERLWILVNLVVAFLHYAYDGMIWKAQRSVPAGRPL